MVSIMMITTISGYNLQFLDRPLLDYSSAQRCFRTQLLDLDTSCQVGLSRIMEARLDVQSYILRERHAVPGRPANDS